MKAFTHLTFAALCGVAAKGFGYEIDTLDAACLGAGALMPDIDRRTSAIGRMTLFVSESIERRFGHRTATHSLLGMAFFAALAMPLALVQDSAFWYFVFGYATHIFLDTWNKEGVPLLWPNRLEFVIYYNRRLRVAYGSSGEFTVLAVISLLALALVPVSMKGFESWFHRLLATPNAAIQDYLLWRDDYEVLAELSGENLLLRKSEKSELRIIDALDMNTLVLEDAAGRAFSTSNMGSVDIHSMRVRANRGTPIETIQFQADVSGQSVFSLIELCSEQALRTLINGEFVIVGQYDLPPLLGEFERVRASGNRLSLRSARPEDLKRIAHLSIESGKALIRSEFVPGEATTAASESLAKRVKGMELPLTLRSIQGLTVNVGETVTEGQTIARNVDQAELEELKLEEDHLRENLALLEERMKSLSEAHRLEREHNQSEFERLQADLERVAYLVEKDARPRADLEKVERAIVLLGEEMDLQAAKLAAAKTELTQQKGDLAARLASCARQRESALKEQLVKAPVSGTVADIRLQSISESGVSLVLLILQEGVL